MKKHLLLSLSILLYLNTTAQTSAQFDKVMTDYHNFNMFDGSVLVSHYGKVIYKKAFGLANREWNIPNATDTRFMIGSVSKPITAFLMLLQVQKGIVDLDKTISDYIPEFSKTNGSRITIRQLLSHTSGMPNYEIISDFFPRISRQNFSREEYIKLYMDSALLFEPGTQFYYSSWGYFTLGYIMEKVTGKSYSQLMKEEIFDKLGMNSSGSYYHTQVVNKRATGYDYDFNGYTSSDFRDQSNTMGTGDLYTTVEDLFKFSNAITENTLLSKKLTDEMLKPCLAPINYGFGWFNKYFKYSTTDSIASNFHLGMTEGFISFMLRIPETNSMVVILCNSSPTDFFGITGNLTKVLLNKPAIVKQPIHKVMETTIGSKGVTEAVAQYKLLKQDTTKYYVDWISLVFLGDKLYDQKRYSDAVVIYEHTATEFPDKDLAQFSLGKAYEAVGRKEDAITYYKKALAIFSGYVNATSRLKALGVK